MLLKTIIMYTIMGIGGMVLSIIGAFFFGSPIAAMFAMFGCFLAIMPMFLMISRAAQKRFLPLFENLAENQKYLHYPDKFGKLGTMIADIKHPGILFKKGLGIIDDKGTEYAWGKDPVSFWEPELGVTVDIPAAQWTHLLHKEENLLDYEQMVRTYLGEDEYVKFANKFRTNPKPDWIAITNEIEYLKNFKPTKDSTSKFSKLVFGQTWGFDTFINYLKYALNPLRVDTAIKTEILIAKQEAAGYRDQSKALNWGKAIMLVLLGLGIFFAIMSALDLKGLGSFFGGIF